MKRTNIRFDGIMSCMCTDKTDEKKNRRNTRHAGSKEEDRPSLIIRIAYKLAYVLLWLLLKLLFRFSYKDKSNFPRLKGPVILVSNHQSFLDPLFALVAGRGRFMRFVTGYFLMYMSSLKGLLRAIKAIPIQQFSADPRAVRSILSALKREDTVVIYPEGQRSINGTSLPFRNNIVRLAEKSGASLVGMRLQGAYLAWPRWRKGIFRPGKVQAELDVICTREDIRKLGRDECEKRLSSFLTQSDHDFVRAKKHYYFSRNKVLGLDRLLHRCPLCGQAESLRSTYNRLNCIRCLASYLFSSDLSFVLDRSQILEAAYRQAPMPDFSDIADWHIWQLKKEAPYLSDLPTGFPEVEAGCQIFDANTGECKEERTGTLFNEQGNFYFRGEDGETLRLPLLQGGLLMFDHGKFFQVTLQEEIIRISPRNPYFISRLADLHLAQVID